MSPCSFYSFSLINSIMQIVCGDVFVGKTQLIHRLLKMPFQSQYYATLGIYPSSIVSYSFNKY